MTSEAWRYDQNSNASLKIGEKWWLLVGIKQQQQQKQGKSEVKRRRRRKKRHKTSHCVVALYTRCVIDADDETRMCVVVFLFFFFFLLSLTLSHTSHRLISNHVMNIDCLLSTGMICDDSDNSKNHTHQGVENFNF